MLLNAYMKKIDIKNVDLKLLTIFLTIYQECSVSGAAAKLDVGQSLISHSLERLRKYFDDPLFVRSGKSITATERAIELAPAVESIVSQLKQLAEKQSFDPTNSATRFVMAANDYERRIIALPTFNTMAKVAPNASLVLSNTSEKMTTPLRNRDWDVVISPQEPPNTGDFYSKGLFKDRFVCFYDKTQISEEEIHHQYTEQRHAIVRFQSDPVSIIDQSLIRHGAKRKIQLIVPSFEALPGFIKGSRLIATLPSRLKNSVFSGFAFTELPFHVSQLEFKLIWHKTTHQSPEHVWFRRLITESIE